MPGAMIVAHVLGNRSGDLSMNHQRSWPTRQLFDVRVDALTMPSVIDLAERAIDSRERLMIGVVNAAKIVKMRRDESLRRAVLGSDLILADGMAVVWASKFMRTPLPERVAGIDLMLELFALAQRRSFKVFLLGAKPEIVAGVQTRLAQDFPNAQIVGTQDGYYPADEEASVAIRIRNSGADMLFVAMTSPRKEKFMAAWGDSLNVPVCHGVGGAFDVYAGLVKRAPRAWQAVGMEWAYRVAQEPRRLGMRYLDTNTVFLGMVARASARRFGARLRRKTETHDANWARVRTSHH